MTDYMKKFKETFDEWCKVKDPNDVFKQIIDMSLEQFIIKNSKSDTKHKIKYSDKEYKLFDEIFQAWVLGMNQKLQKEDWFDWFGDFYQGYILSKHKANSKGQFFTPAPVSDFMRDITVPADFNSQGKLVNDACCGSGRNLLSYQGKHQGSYLFGEDIDETACKMCVLNFLIHGVVGSVKWMDSLTGEFFYGWKVNEYLHHGLPVPHVVVSKNPRFLNNFIGMKHAPNPIMCDEKVEYKVEAVTLQLSLD